MRYRLNNREVTRQEFLADAKGLKSILAARRVNTSLHSGWPMHSDALGVHPSQIREAYEESVRMGVPTSFDKDGCAILTSRGHRKRYAEANGMFDRNGGYGDAQARNL